VIDQSLWCLGFPGVVITVDIRFGPLRYGVKPDLTAAKCACLWFSEGQLENLSSPSPTSTTA
jgi:hypothetical protein